MHSYLKGKDMKSKLSPIVESPDNTMSPESKRLRRLGFYTKDGKLPRTPRMSKSARKKVWDDIAGERRYKSRRRKKTRKKGGMEGGYGGAYYSEGYDEDERATAPRREWGSTVMDVRLDGRSAKDLRPLPQDVETRRRSLKYKVNEKIRELLTEDHIKFVLKQGGRKNFEYLEANEKGVVTKLGPCLLDKDEKSPEEKIYYKGIIRRAYHILERERILNSNDTTQMLPESLQEVLSRDEIEAEEQEKMQREAAKNKAEQERLAERERQKAFKNNADDATRSFMSDMFGIGSDSD